MKSHSKVTIVGGGIMGVSLLYHLTKEGWNDIVLVEKGELTSGSTWHAAGQCPHFVGSFNSLSLRNEILTKDNSYEKKLIHKNFIPNMESKLQKDQFVDFLYNYFI